MPTPRERLLSVIAGEKPDRVPFTIWNNKIPDDATLKVLLKHEACVLIKSLAYETYFDGVRVERELCFGEDGAVRTRLTYHTPAGSVTAILRSMPGTIWVEKHLFSGPDDYDALEYILSARRHTPCPERVQQGDTVYPGQSIARPETLHSPLHEVMNDLMGVEEFCIEWFENGDRIERLCELVREDLARRVKLLAAGPAVYCVIDGNTQFDIVGLERYEQYFIPYINEACEALQAAGKLVGAHLDGNNAVAAQLIARTKLDFVESFSPPPDCDLSLADARLAWPEKTLVMNFPSSVHLGGAERVRQRARELLGEAGDCRGVVMGVTEDVPTSEHLALLAEETRKWRVKA
jgi:hypothetical protein